ncbi:sel1 repeat family protein [Pseudomonas sp. QL9]|uniref:SEL1-like repeat protein n=1 Tax=Pseudomonas sp. QL9 TaxID=3242725 RepID=UPI00352BAFE1
MHRFLLISSLLLAACSASSPDTYSKKEFHVDRLSQIKSNLAFTCKYETIPSPSADSDVLFQYGRWLEKNNQLKQEPSVYGEIERLYRIASESGHYKANINLQNGAMRGHYTLKGAENLRMSQKLIDAKIARGYFFIGYFLQQGSAGLKKNEELALRYFRKAADEGNAEAQYQVADMLSPTDIAPDIARQMRRCSAEQGHGEAALELGINMQGKGQVKEALEAFQMGVAGGDETAAYVLEKGFRDEKAESDPEYLGLLIDIERSERYKKIGKILSGYSYAQPKVPEINEIVPLPPAKLPPWDGKLKWVEERKANVQPPKPSESLIQELAKAKLLDPKTGRPMPGSPAFVRTRSPAPICNSGEACPRSGYWQIIGVDNYWSIVEGRTIRRFQQGERMPTPVIERRYTRLWPLPDKVTKGPESVRWVLYGDA